jgi:hypothetical protein
MPRTPEIRGDTKPTPPTTACSGLAAQRRLHRFTPMSKTKLRRVSIVGRLRTFEALVPIGVSKLVVTRLIGYSASIASCL